ncbi:hypothetical protein EalM132_00073 [Exiguobacterium phage vB_EalM-132]|nr:hypothetical protein EalM132_00073 [Exiguobacterium phage vB_EalM-132]
MATTKPKAKAEGEETPKPVVLEPRIHLTEFIATHPELSDLQVAGIKSLSGNKDWMSKTEWEDILKGYTN